MPTSLTSKFVTPTAVVTLFVFAMSGCVLGLVAWKSSDARTAALVRGETDIKNLSHSLAQHAAHSIQAADIALSGMVDLLKYRDPLPERFNPYLRKVATSLPQLREVAVLAFDGSWKYSSLPELPTHNNSDREYFIRHRDSSDSALHIGSPIISRITGRPTLVLSKRITGEDGHFNGVAIATIDIDYFHKFYATFNLGQQGGISLLGRNGIVLVHWPSKDTGRDLSQTALFQVHLKQNSTGYYKVISPFDGVTKYFGYEQSFEYPIVTSVALSEEELLASWRSGLGSDLLVALIVLCSVILMAALLATQFRHRLKIERHLRKREEQYRLLADNISDIVFLFDKNWTLIYVSQSVQTLLGYRPQNLIGRSCVELIHPDDRPAVTAACANLDSLTVADTVTFRMAREDGGIIWLESTFKLTEAGDADTGSNILSVLRDVTQRRSTEDELKSLHVRLAHLATTDSLTGLANRRAFDGFFRREFEAQIELSVLLFDIDNFKGFNDSQGHLAGDNCLTQVATVIAGATNGSKGLSARYGGEEFVIVLPGISEEKALQFGEAIRKAIGALRIPNPASSSQGFVSISVGVSSKTEFSGTELFLIGEADLALYEAKRRGRNQSVAYSSLVASFSEASLIPLKNAVNLPATQAVVL